MEQIQIEQWLGQVKNVVLTNAIQIILIDGYCGSGKSRLAKKMANAFDAPLVHMDDYYLPFDQRKKIKDFPGNHMDYDRLQQCVIDPFINCGQFIYIPYDAHLDRYGPSKQYDGNRLIIEGSYCMHPFLEYEVPVYRLFLTIDPLVQKQRIIQRGGMDCWEGFEQQWIPAEHRYFTTYDIQKQCDQTIEYEDSFIRIASMKTVS